MRRPHHFVPSVFDIPYGQLWEEGKRALLYDIDNTLCPHGEPLPSPEVLGLLQQLQQQGFKVGLLSNNREGRVQQFNGQLQLPSRYRARKPLTRKIKALLAEMAVPPAEAVLVGDQIFTDVWCGHRAGLTTVLVAPFSTRDLWTIHLKRIPERWLLRRWKLSAQR